MQIIIPRLPKNTLQGELEHVAHTVLGKKFYLPFSEAPKILSYVILKIQDEYGCTDLHGIVNIMPDKAGKWFIQHIRKERLHNKRLLARQYYLRGKERRSRRPDAFSDRRRTGLKVIRTSAGRPKYETKGVDVFRREY